MTIREQDLRDKIDETIAAFGDIPWGVCDYPDDIGLPDHYEKVLVVPVPFLWPLPLKDYKEPIFKHLQTASFERTGRIASALKDLLRAEGLRHGEPSHSNAEDFERKMNEGFSTKESARLAGLGWIGKNNLFISYAYGPQVNTIAIFIDAPLTSGTPVTESRCGDCTNCIDNCPFRVIKGVPWSLGLPREEQVDFATCSTTRLKTYEHLGRKITCAKCVIACPHGWKPQRP
jgi:ferredoxin